MAPRVNRKTIEKYFVLTKDKASCKLCSHTLKRDRVFNLKTHVIKVHQVNGEEFAIEDNGVRDSSNTITLKKLRNQVVKIEISKKQFFRSYIGLVTEDGIPFNILNSDNFKNIINPICRGLSIKYKKNISLNSSKCKKVLKVVSDNIRDAIKTELKQRLLSIKIDSASDLSRNVFAVSAQFIKNNEIQSRILGMVELRGVGASSSRNLAKEILSTLTKYNINSNQIVSITSDNATNIIIFEEGQDGHDTDDANEIYLKNIEMFEDSSEIDLGDIQICRCLAHRAQLCALDVTKDTEIKKFVLNSRNLVKYIKKPCNGLWDTFEHKSLTMPQLDCPTIWGSTYDMITSLKNAKNILTKIKPIKKESADENFELNDSFWDFVESYCIAFEPLHYTIAKFQENQLHYGNFYAEWLKCKILTGKILEKGGKRYIEKIAKSLLLSMESRTCKLLKNENLISCLYLDPRFNHTLNLTQKFEAATYLKKLYERIKSINKVHTAPKTKTELPCSSLGNNHFSQLGDDYLNEYLTQNFEPATSECIDVRTKIENLQLPFLRVDSNVLHFWRDKQHSDPELYALSNICFAVPSTQMTIERAFSLLKLISTNSPDQINQDTLENILLVKLNGEYLDEAIEALPWFDH